MQASVAVQDWGGVGWEQGGMVLLVLFQRVAGAAESGVMPGAGFLIL